MKEYKLIKADSTVQCRKGSLKVETPLGVFLISVGLEKDGKGFETVMVYPNIHPGEKKILIKRSKDNLMLVRCKTARRK